MRHLTTVQGSFHARVLAARLGAEGVLVELRGMCDGPYPIATLVDVLVDEGQLALGREILLADAVDAAVDGDLVELEELTDLDLELGAWPGGPVGTELSAPGVLSRRRPWPAAAITLVLVVVLVVVGLVAAAA
jgi:hypothetical protein